MIPYAWCTPDTNLTLCVKDTSIKKKLLETSCNDWGHLPTLEAGGKSSVVSLGPAPAEA